MSEIITTELIHVEQPELKELIPTSKLEITKAESILIKYAPFFSQIAEVKKDANKIDKENPTAFDCEIAGKLRKRLVKIRTASADVKDEGKAQILIEGRLEDSAYGVVKNSCMLLEKDYEAIEKAAEIKEAKRKADLKIARTEILSQYISNPEIYPLGEMEEDSFNDLIEGFKLAKAKKIEDEKRAAEELIAKEKKDREEREAQRLENERLKKLAEEQERVLAIERENAAKEKKIADAILKAEQEKAEIERKKVESERAKEKAFAESKLLKEKQEREKIEAELKAKKEKELADILKVAEAEKAKELAEKKAKAAPDKQKIKEFSRVLSNLSYPELKSEDAIEIMNNVKVLIDKTINFIITKTNEL